MTTTAHPRQLFEAAHNSDQTEGRGHMVGFAWFDTLDQALEATRGHGVMGQGDGDVFLLEILTDLEQINTNRGPLRRTRIYDGNSKTFTPGWHPDGVDPEWAEYQRLRAKFDNAPVHHLRT